MDDQELKKIIEALIMSASSPISLARLQEVFEDWEKPSIERLESVVSLLAKDYQSHAIELKCLASGYVFQTKAAYSSWISRFQVEKPPKYSNALIETLAIIAYRQPVTRAEIEDIRGVSVATQIIKTLTEREWIRIAGHRDVPGKPAVYTTTKAFLDYFNLQNLRDLPVLPLINNALIPEPEKEVCVTNEH